MQSNFWLLQMCLICFVSPCVLCRWVAFISLIRPMDWHWTLCVCEPLRNSCCKYNDLHFMLISRKTRDRQQKFGRSEVAQSCPTLYDLIDCSLPGSSVHGIFQAHVLEWVAISFARGFSWPRDRTWVSRMAARHFTVRATREANLEIWTRG